MGLSFVLNVIVVSSFVLNQSVTCYHLVVPLPHLVSAHTIIFISYSYIFKKDVTYILIQIQWQYTYYYLSFSVVEFSMSSPEKIALKSSQIIIQDNVHTNNVVCTLSGVITICNNNVQYLIEFLVCRLQLPVDINIENRKLIFVLTQSEQ